MGPVRQIQAGVVGYIDEGPPDGQAVVLLHPPGVVSSGVRGRLVERLRAKWSQSTSPATQLSAHAGGRVSNNSIG
jgi:hypothetical protein